MKKPALYILIAFLMLAVIPSQLSAITDPVPADSLAMDAYEAELVIALTARLNEIKDIDKTNMTAAEKRKLRKEVRKIKKDLKAVSGGVYISVGALILIVLLLILLL